VIGLRSRAAIGFCTLVTMLVTAATATATATATDVFGDRSTPAEPGRFDVFAERVSQDVVGARAPTA